LEFIGKKYLEDKIQVYIPAEDSYFFSNFLENYLSNKKNKNIYYLDMGSGTGILSKTASKFLKKENITASDINPLAVKLTKQQGFKTIKSNLFEKIQGKFDLITFNAPYLPEDKREPMDSRVATTGGIKGDEISVEFIKQAKKHLNKDGKIFLLISSLTPKNKIKKQNPKIIARKKIFAEELFILEIY